MSWFKPNVIAKASDFFVGVNINNEINNSLFGKIKKAVMTIFGSDVSEEYTLPRVIVIGNESAGKSSLLENITKCQIFPRDAKMCTKCPIHLKLKTDEKHTYSINYKGQDIIIKNKYAIYNKIAQYMKDIGEGNISTDVITINITGPTLPVFEFIDLPGIVSYPENIAKQTLDISKKYLNDSNTIVLCVVPATTTRLTSCQSIALIKEMKMEQNTILALTMADRVQPVNIGDLLVSRLLNTSDELKDINFNGYVAVVNRTHDNSFNLAENDTMETKWFNDNIISCIPVEHKKDADYISQNVTINKLVKQLDKLYSMYIEKEWKPSVLNRMKEKLNNLEEQYKKLGPIITDEDIIIIVKNIMESYKNSYIDNKTMFDFVDIIDDSKTSNTRLSDNYYIIRDNINTLNRDDIVNIFNKYIVPIIEKLFTDKLPYVLERFVFFKGMILNDIRNNIVNIWSAEEIHIKNCLITVLNDKLLSNKQLSVERELSTLIKTIIFDKVYSSYDSDFIKKTYTINDFVENDIYQQNRKKIKSQINDVERQLNYIDKLKTENL